MSVLAACSWVVYGTGSDFSVPDSADSVQSLDKMVVVGRRSTSYAVSTRTLTAEDFAGKHSDIADVLNTLCGVSIHRTGGLGAYTDMSIRGSGTNQVHIYLDGLPLNSASGGSVDLSKIPLNQISEITMYSAASPLHLSGMNAGGVIELRTDPRKNFEFVTGAAEVGSYGYMKAGALLNSIRDRFSHRLSIDYAHSDNDFPYTYNPTRYKTGDEQEKTIDNHQFTSIHALYANTIRFDSAAHSLKSQLSIGTTNNGLFNYETPDSNDGYSRDRTVSLTEEYTGVFWDNALLVKGNISARYKENLFQRERAYFIGGSRKRQSEYPYAGAWATGDWRINESVSLKGLLGGAYEGYEEKDLWSDQFESINPYAHRLTARGGMEAAFTFSNRLFARCKGALAYHIDSTNGISLHVLDDVSPRSVTGYNPSMQAEIRFETPHALSFSLSGIYNNRSPSLTEKFARGNKAYGKEDLDNETRIEGEAGISWNGSMIRSSLIGYAGKTLNKIKWIARAQNTFVPENIETVNGAGVEWDVTLTPWKWLIFSNRFTFMHNIIESDEAYWNGQREPLLPAIKENCEVQLTLPWVTVGHSLSYSSPYYLGPQNIDYIDPGVTLDMHISLIRFEGIEVTYRIDNYLDKVEYTARGHEFFDRLPKPGRMHYLSCRLAL